MADTSQEDAQESTQLFETLRRAGFKASDAHYTIKSIENMAGARIEARIGRMEKTIYILFTIIGLLITGFGLWANWPR